MAVDIDKLEALAKAATPGPWKSTGDRNCARVDDPSGKCITAMSVGDWGWKEANLEDADAEFIAAANPTAVIELLEILDRWRRFCAEYEQRLQAVYDERDRLRAGLAEALEIAGDPTDAFDFDWNSGCVEKMKSVVAERVAELRKLVAP